jgi:predicted lipoprotein with Yx(FWY)xxD motif
MTHTSQFRAGTLGAVVAVALAVAGCGSSGSSSSATKATGAYSSAPASSSSGALTISTTKGPAGVYLTGANGRAIYLWAADTGGKSACSGSCAKVWTPVVVTATPSASGGVNAADLSTTARTDGSKQVTYMGHPLYYYVADPKAGTTRGQGSDSFGSTWWLIGTSGAPIHSSSASSSSSSSSNGSSGSGSSGSSTTTSSGGWA